MKNTKKALFTSALCLLLCMSMLVGTTFAWFTDKVESLNNKIVAGNLDVELEYSKDFENWNTVGADTDVFEEELWEPGRTEVVYLRVKNVGTLALKYILNVNIASETGSINVHGDEFELSDYIKYGVVEVSGKYADRAKAQKAVETVAVGLKEAYAPETQTLYPVNNMPEDGSGVSEIVLAMVVYMPISVGNEANYKTGEVAPEINLGISLLATQLEYEEDSFGNDYDANAKYLIPVGESATLLNPVIAEGVTNNGTLIITGGTITNDGIGLENYGDAKLEDVTVNAGTPGTGAFGYAINSGAGANTVLDNVAVDSKNGAIGATDGAQVTINSGSIAVNSQNTSGRYNIYAVGEGTVVTVNGGEYSFSKTLNQKRAYVYAGAGATVYINGGTFGKASTRSGYTAGIKTDGSTATVIIKGGTFGFDPTTWVAAGYKAVKNGTTWTVIPESAELATDNATFSTAIQNGATTVYLGSGDYVIPAAAQGKTLKIVGNGSTSIAVTKVGTGGENCDYGLDGSTVVFENVTITTNSSTYIGYARCNGTYNNCTINGTYTLYGNSVFNNCTFNVSGDVYNIWTWGAPTAEFNNCTFNSDGKAVLLYGTANTKLIVNGCTFNDKGGLADLKAAIEIGNDYGKSYELIVTNTTVNGYEINDKGISTGTTLWANKNSMGTDKLNVVVDGVDVY